MDDRWIFRISILSVLEGTPISNSLSNRPGRRKAESIDWGLEQWIEQKRNTDWLRQRPAPVTRDPVRLIERAGGKSFYWCRMKNGHVTGRDCLLHLRRGPRGRRGLPSWIDFEGWLQTLLRTWSWDRRCGGHIMECDIPHTVHGRGGSCLCLEDHIYSSFSLGRGIYSRMPREGLRL